MRDDSHYASKRKQRSSIKNDDTNKLLHCCILKKVSKLNKFHTYCSHFN